MRGLKGSPMTDQALFSAIAPPLKQQTEQRVLPEDAIGIMLSSGLVDTLDTYRGLGVAEVWTWEADKFNLYRLCADGYEQITHSELLPEYDIDLLADHVESEEQFYSVMALRDELRSR